ncbi:winged helix-turn-helix domain-containing protein [Calidithermus roseus]|uniref:Winged helix DNA-binding domain protein n=1 Tax=Calidithermus roseus TaxID=1644118 RepID=A0A399EJ67_9DEIN|nr:crosslink repair DNA glycosylase YcaQ family protein [Calidithermus roseus]RIH83483.1 Winged helix DNA-binding domain protein [Calidithermus roseus]
MKPIETTPSALRRVILARQGLLEWSGGRGGWAEGGLWREELGGPEGVLEVLRRLEAVQLDPVNVVAPNHHLVLHNRLRGYRGEHLEALYPARRVFEYWAQARCILPIEDWAVFELRRQRWRLEHTIYNRHGESYESEIYEAIAHIRQRLEAEGPLSARRLDNGKKVQGYWGFTTKATSQAIEHLWEAGELVVAYRRGDERYFALTSQWFPDLPQAPADPQAKLMKFVRAYGVIDAGDQRLGWLPLGAAERKALLEPLLRQGVLLPLHLEGLRRRYYLWAELLPLLEALQGAKVAPRVTLLSPLDNLLWRRERIQDLWGFEYRWEIYVPEPKRRYGPYVLPVLEGEALVARVDARMERPQGRLRVRRVWWEREPAAGQVKRLWRALADLARAQGVELEPPRPAM